MGIAREDIQSLLDFRLPRWEDLPEYDLYNEQLVQYVKQALAPLVNDDKALTPTMVQNYVKWKSLPRPDGKKYDRKHIVWCIVITLLKRILTIQEIERGIRLQMKLVTLEDAYDSFCDQLELSLKQCFVPFAETSRQYTFPAYTTEAHYMAVRSVCQSLCYKLLTERVLARDGFALQADAFAAPLPEESETEKSEKIEDTKR